MARKKRQRISYVLPLASTPGGHRLGVNGLALDQDQAILYSGARDGAICAWDLNVDLHAPSTYDLPAEKTHKPAQSTFRSQVQAHTHWVNDIILTQSNSALVSASSDVTVKIWRPQSAQSQSAVTIGKHSDYVKCLATPAATADWVASGGLDHKIKLWDLNGAGEKLEIDVGGQENVAKGSIYALSAKGSVIASGGPESVLRVWDPKTGKGITKLVGHTDNIRDILISDDGETIMTASSDQTVKLWSLAAGRCMHTLTMHNDSVWSLYSDHPRLSLFYSSDRSGLVAKTDTRNTSEIDDGVSVAAIQEQDGVNKVVAGGSYIWTATSSSSINRWQDIDTEAPIEEPPPQPHQDLASQATLRNAISATQKNQKAVNGDSGKRTIPYTAVLKLSITSPLRGTRSREAEIVAQTATNNIRKASEAVLDSELGIITPVRDVAEACIEGQNGLSKHIMLNDRKRVLTQDTTGEIVLWDLLKCVPIKSFGKRHLDDIAEDINTRESVANWCTVDTRTGKLSVILEENYCFDAEVYADEIEIDENIEFREDQRLNLGKWVLRHLFANLIDEEIKRDEAYRKNLAASSTHANSLHRSNAPNSIALPALEIDSESNGVDGTTIATPKAQNGTHARTPGLSIGVATPGVSHPTLNTNLPRTVEEESKAHNKTSSSQTPLGDHSKPQDYFSTNPTPSETSSDGVKAPSTPSEAPVTGATPTSPTTADGEKGTEEKKKSSGLFGKKFQMSFPKKLGRASLDAKPQQAAEAEKSEDSDDNKSSDKDGASTADATVRSFTDNFFGVVQKIHSEYDDQLNANADQPLMQGITPSLPIETPVLKPPGHTQILIQEDNPESGGVVDLYEGAVATLGKDADAIEHLAPMWLGELLLRNQLPLKETVKVSFVLQPHETSNLPNISSTEGNSRLNANRMLRTKKILAYIAERIEPAPEKPEDRPLRPEEYLELWCQGQLVSPNITLGTLRVHIWRTGGDVMLYYRANGKKSIKGIKETAKTGPSPTALPENENGEFGHDDGAHGDIG